MPFHFAILWLIVAIPVLFLTYPVCFFCIANHIQRGGKFCPICKATSEKKAINEIIMKDPFKQNLVNELDSEMVEKEKTLFKRLHEIFPEFEIKTIYNDFYNCIIVQ